MLSLSRDLLVPIPGTPQEAGANAADPAGSANANAVGLLAPFRGQQAKLNTANFFGDLNHYPGGGPELARQTVSNFLGQPIDYWARVNFDGFRYMIDQVGGIDIDVPTAINDPEFPDEGNGYAPLYIPAGHIHMDGALALDYARTRHQDSDYQRARRQQQVVLAFKEKLLQPGELARLLPRLPEMALTLARSVQTDMPIATGVTLARRLALLDLKNVTQVVIDNTMGQDGNDPTWGFVLIPNVPKVRAAAARAYADHPVLAEAPLGSPTPSPIQEEAARLAILNGSTEKDLPDLVAMSLAGTGFRVVGVGSAGSEGYAQTWLITHGDGWPATRAWLISRFGITPDHVRSAPPDGIADLVLVLGNDTAHAAQVP
jgi:LCP family protein required for cell wall assembly